MFYLGICDVLVQGFVDKLSNENKTCIDYMTVSVVSTYKHHNMEYFPRLTAFRNGFVKDVVPILTGRDKFAKVLREARKGLSAGMGGLRNEFLQLCITFHL